MHDFPDAAQLVQTRKQLGELLTTWQAVEPERLQQALAQQHAGRRQPLGRILLTQGWLDDETLAEAIAFQGDLPRAVIDVDYLRAGSFPVSADACVQWRMLPLPPRQQQTLRLAVASPLPEDALALLKQETRSAHIEQSIARESEINAGLRLIGGDQHWQLDNVPLLGDLLVEMRLIDHARFEIALDAYKPQRDGRIGDYLVKQGITTEEAVAQAMQEQRRRAAALQSPPPGALPA
jgi:adsorption protein B